MTYINIVLDEEMVKHTMVTIGLLFIGFNMSSITLRNCKRFFYRVWTIYNEICEMNPLLYDYSDDKEKENEKNVELEAEILEEKVFLYENKYLEKFKAFPNEYLPFTEEELVLNDKIYAELITNHKDTQKKQIDELSLEKDRLTNLIERVETAGGPLTEEGLKAMLEYDQYIDELDLEDEDEEYAVIETYDEMKANLTRVKEELEAIVTGISDEKLAELDKLANDTIIQNRIKGLMNSVLLEMTPVGNIFMRYNFEKESFEYFSNNSIPYRYLETAGRRYVMTFWCKPLFIDLEDELKRAEVKFNEDKKKEEERAEQEKQQRVAQSISGITTNRSVLTKLKSYNTGNNGNGKQSTSIGIGIGKNRSNPLPPQIKANLPDLNSNQGSDKQLLKEHANRYTWEGRFQDFCPIKKIDKKVLDKKLSMSWAEYKKQMTSNK